jgi:hypothetical protein
MLPFKALFLGSTLLLWTSLGCATTSGGVALRPDGSPGPQQCPEEAKTAMRYLKLHVMDSALVELDANQIKSQPITVYDGPIESILEYDLGSLQGGTRLYGQVWTAGPQVVIRYYEAQLDNGTAPICAVARLSENQLRKQPGSKPGMAILEFSRAGVDIVDAFR